MIVDRNDDGQTITHETLWTRTGYELFSEMKKFADSFDPSLAEFLSFGIKTFLLVSSRFL